MQLRYFDIQNFRLESGFVFENLRIGYTIFGDLSPDAKVIWVCHALTASADPTSWWNGLIGENDFFNGQDFCVICANIIGSPYGSSFPLDTDELSGNKYFDLFPLVTIRDNVAAFELLRNHLKIEKIYGLLGGSMGGFIALEWSCTAQVFENLILIATGARQSAWGIAWNEAQRMAIKADRTYFSKHEDGGKKGLAAARAIALLGYRGYQCYVDTQTDKDHVVSNHLAAGYQQYQGKKLVDRFNAFSYVSLLNTMDTHNVARNRQNVREVLQSVSAKTLVIGISSDEKFPVCEQKHLADHIPNADFVEIDSAFGHDGFLIETTQISVIIQGFLSHSFSLQNYGTGAFIER